MKKYSETVANQSQLELILIPISDGLTISKVKNKRTLRGINSIKQIQLEFFILKTKLFWIGLFP
jgi:hypothetical protein